MPPIQDRIIIMLRPNAKDDLAGIQYGATRKAAFKAFALIRGMTLVQLRAHPGLAFEKLQNLADPGTGKDLWSFRITKKARALCVMEPGPTLVIVLIEPDHDKAYR